MSKKHVAGALSVVCGIALAAWAAPALAAGSPNYATSTHPNWFQYNGYVQCQASYIEAKQRAARGYLRYQIPGGRDTGRLYTSRASGPTDSRIHSRSYTFGDSLNPAAAKTQFYYGFDWVPANSPWPYSLEVGNE